MNSLKEKVFTGAAWMLSMRLVVNSLGIISSIILARLLVPDDFGLTALAGTAFAFLQVLGSFGFDSALIHKQTDNRAYYDTAWTINAIFGLTSAFLLWLISDSVAEFFGDDRISAIVKVFALFSLTKGFENIGFVKHRKALRYDKDFYFFVVPKFLSLFAAIPIAYFYRTFWALVVGMAVSRVATLIYSYTGHNFRPRPNLSKTRELFGFSQWIMLSSVLAYVGQHGVQVLIGRYATPFASGVFSLSKDIARLPSTELIQPINRALFPGFSKIAHDSIALKNVYLKSLSGIASITVPAAVGIFALSDWIVVVLLGDKWIEAIPVIQILALAGMIDALKGGVSPLFLAAGRPGSLTALSTLFIVLMFPSFGYLLYKYDLNVAVIAIPVVLILTLPQWIWLLRKVLPLSLSELVTPVWRPAVGTAVMYVVVTLLKRAVEASAGETGFAVLIVLMLAGAAVYMAVVYLLWRIAGMPLGFEETLLEIAKKKLAR